MKKYIACHIGLSAPFIRKLGLAGLSGLLSILIFPTWNIEILAWFVFLPLFVAIESEQLHRTFWLGWFAGFIHFLGTLYWLTVTMVLYGGLPQWLSVVFLILLSMYLALYLGMFSLLSAYLQRRTSVPLILSAPILWVGFEYLRSFFFIGFPWNFLGYSQVHTPSVTQFADISGVYGVSFLIVFINAGLYTLLFCENSSAQKIKTAGVMLVGLTFCVGYSLLVLSATPVLTDPPGTDSQAGSLTVHSSASTDSLPASEYVRVAVVQGNIDQAIKWDRRHRQHILDVYLRLSRDTLVHSPDLIVWPETALPFIFQYERLPFVFHDEHVYKPQLLQFVRDTQTPLLFGGLDIVPIPPPERYYTLNSAFLLDENAELLEKYDKIHLVPFGEYVPFEHILFFVERLTTAIGTVHAGTSYQVMPLSRTSFATVICFEVIFPNLVRKFVDNGARFLVTITNDAWFGKTAASYQHFAMVAFRAIENRVAIARAANTGISGFIDPCGRIVDNTEIFTEATSVQPLPLRTTTTFYTRYGDLFAKGCLGISLLWIAYVVIQIRIRRE